MQKGVSCSILPDFFRFGKIDQRQHTALEPINTEMYVRLLRRGPRGVALHTPTARHTSRKHQIARRQNKQTACFGRIHITLLSSALLRSGAHREGTCVSPTVALPRPNAAPLRDRPFMLAPTELRIRHRPQSACAPPIHHPAPNGVSHTCTFVCACTYMHMSMHARRVMPHP